MVIQIIDDLETTRDSFQELFEDIDMQSNSLNKINSNLTIQFESFSKDDFIISDYNLKNHTPDYSKYNGDIIIAEAYKKQIPGILCSSFVSSDFGLSRVRKRYIPKIILTQDLSKELSIQDSDYINKTREIICNEFKEKFTKERRPWRALLRTTYYDTDHKIVYVEIPSWKPDTQLSIPLSDFPKNLKKKVINSDFRFHAIVNLDCEKAEDVYIDKIEEK